MSNKRLLAVALCIVSGWIGLATSTNAVDLQEGDIVAVDRYNSGIIRIDPVTGVQEFIVYLALDDPRYIAIEADGMLLVTEASIPAVVRVDPTTGIITTIVSGEPPFCHPAGIAVEADGSILVADQCAQTIFRIDPVTAEVSILASGLPMRDPTGIALDGDGDIVVADANAGVIRVNYMTGEQEVVSPLGPVLFFPGGIAVEANGDILVTDFYDEQLIRVDPLLGGQTVFSDFGFDDPYDVAVEEGGDILVSLDVRSAAAVLRIDPVTGAQTEVTTGPTDSLIGLLVVPAPVPTLTISGNCPGTLSVEVSNATAGGAVALASGTLEGPFTVPAGRPCAGLQIGLADPALITVLNADATGTLSLSPAVGAGACGVLVQALDIVTCTTTAVSSVP